MGLLDGLSPYQIGGNLNFGSSVGPGDYQGAYNNALGLNRSNYQNILEGYQGLTSSVLGNLTHAGDARALDINEAYGSGLGGGLQNLISKGTGGPTSTVRMAMERGVLSDREKARTQLASQMAGLYANTQSQLGQAQLGFMNSVNSLYPNLDAYNRYWQQRGAVAQGRNGMGMNNNQGGGNRGAGTAVALPQRNFAGIGGVGSFNPGSNNQGGGLMGAGGGYQQSRFLTSGGGILDTTGRPGTTNDPWGNVMNIANQTNDLLKNAAGDYYGSQPLGTDYGNEQMSYDGGGVVDGNSGGWRDYVTNFTDDYVNQNWNDIGGYGGGGGGNYQNSFTDNDIGNYWNDFYG